MSRIEKLHSLALLHPTFESWGGAEWTIHGILEALRRLYGTRATLITHRYVRMDGASPSYRVIEHHSGGELSEVRDWESIAAAIASELDAAQVTMVHNYPAVHWIAPDVETPAVWYCHEPPRRLHGPHSGEVGLRPGIPRSPRDLVSSIAKHGRRSIPLALGRLRLLRERGAVSSDARLAELRRLEREAVGRLDTVLANSRYTASRVREIYGREAEVVTPVPSDLELLFAERASKERLVAWAGRMTSMKRPLEMVRAWCAWRSRHDPHGRWRLVMVGDGPLADEVRREAHARASGAVEIFERLERDDLAALFARSLLVVHTALAEPFGLIPLEAMACGTAVLAHAEGGVLDTVEDDVSGWLAEADDEDALTEALSSVLTNEETLLATGRRARERARERFDFQATIERLHDVLAARAAG